MIAQKSKLRLTQEVTAALASHSRGRSASRQVDFFRVQSIASTCIAMQRTATFFCGRRPLPFGGSHLRLPSGPAGIRTTTGNLSALARPTPYQLSHRVACYAADGYRSPCGCVFPYNGSPVLVNRLRGNKIHFHQAVKDWRMLIMPSIHYFDAHRR